MPPEGSDLILSSNIPNGEGNVLVLDGFDVESCDAKWYKREPGGRRGQ